MFCIQMMSELITIQKQFLAKTVEMSLWPAPQVALVDAVACGWEKETLLLAILNDNGGLLLNASDWDGGGIKVIIKGFQLIMRHYIVV